MTTRLLALTALIALPTTAFAVVSVSAVCVPSISSRLVCANIDGWVAPSRRESRQRQRERRCKFGHLGCHLG